MAAADCSRSASTLTPARGRLRSVAAMGCDRGVGSGRGGVAPREALALLGTPPPRLGGARCATRFRRRAAPSSRRAAPRTSATESTVAVGPTPDAATASGRYLPVRTSTPARPVRRAPPTSLSTSSPTITASAGRTPSPVSTVAKKAGAGLPTTTASHPVVYSSAATKGPTSRRTRAHARWPTERLRGHGDRRPRRADTLRPGRRSPSAAAARTAQPAAASGLAKMLTRRGVRASAPLSSSSGSIAIGPTEGRTANVAPGTSPGAARLEADLAV